MAKKTLRVEICKIISEMLDNPDEVGIYPTTKCYNQLLNLFSQFGDRVIGSEERVTVHDEDGKFLREGEGYQTRNNLRKEQKKRKEKLLKEKNG